MDRDFLPISKEVVAPKKLKAGGKPKSNPFGAKVPGADRGFKIPPAAKGSIKQAAAAKVAIKKKSKPKRSFF